VVPASSALLCFYCYCYPRDLHSFPTRRSSDLSRHYADVRQVYQTALANGGAASGPFIPELDNHPADPQAEQARLLQAWQKSGAALVKAAQSWKDTDLDRIRLPHPLIGLLTVREMLLWNIYHDLHHLDDVRRLLETA